MNIWRLRYLLSFLLNGVLLGLFCGCEAKKINLLPEKIITLPIPDLPLLSELSELSSTGTSEIPKYQQSHFICEANPLLSFTIGIPFSWISVPLDTYFLPNATNLTLVARFCKHQKTRVVPFTEIYIFPIQKDIFPEDWLLWYLEKQQWKLLRQARENLSNLNKDTVLYQTTSGCDLILGRLSAFQWGDKLWIVSSICLENQYAKESSAFAIFASSLAPTNTFRQNLLEWNALPMPECSRVLLYPNSFEAIPQKDFIQFQRKDRQESWIRFWFSNPSPEEILVPINFSKKTTKLLNPSGKPIKLEQFLEPSLEYLLLELDFQQIRLVIEMQSPRRDLEPLIWMENKYVLEKLCQPLFSEKKEKP
ncbi:MAG: hypothetical protein AABZ60_25465 [Planctomycetota bacterium]